MYRFQQQVMTPEQEVREYLRRIETNNPCPLKLSEEAIKILPEFFDKKYPKYKSSE